MRLIDADTVVTIQVYDDMTETISTKKMTIADAIDEWSDEGCPLTIDARSVRHGMWIKMSDAGQDIIFCSECGKELPRGVINSSNPQFDLSLKIKYMDKTAYCPNCGAKMDKETADELDK